ncbi:hypothetical protein RI367_005792 [Sorochytrium milnesiophthora]
MSASANGSSSNNNNTSSNSSSSSSSTSKRKAGAEFLSKTRFKNTVQPLPFDPKSLLFPFPPDHLYKYALSSLEKYAPYSLVLPEVPIDLIQLGAFDDLDGDVADGDARHKFQPLDKRDEPLMAQPHRPGSVNTLSLAKNRPLVPWLRRTEHTESEINKASSQKSALSKFEKPVKPEILSKEARTREGQVRVIEAMFTRAQAAVSGTLKKSVLRHPSKPDLTVAEVMPLLPDLSLWPNTYMHVTFDDSPLAGTAAGASQSPNNDDGTQQLKPDHAGLFRARVSDQLNTTVFGYYVPTEEGMEQLVRLEEDGVQEEEEIIPYSYYRDYTFHSKPEAQLKKLILCLQSKPPTAPGQTRPASYCSIQTRLRVTKRRGKHNEHAASMLLVKRRKLTPEEVSAREQSVINLGVSEEEARRHVSMLDGFTTTTAPASSSLINAEPAIEDTTDLSAIDL